MKIINRNGYEGEEAKNVALQNIFDILNGEDVINSDTIDKEVLRYIISWLPYTAEISVWFSYDNKCTCFAFVNGENIKLYNTGLEEVFAELAKN